MSYEAEAVDFFKEHAGFSVRGGETTEQGRERSARELAQAELWASTMGGLVFEWEDDPDHDGYCDCGEGHGPAYGCIVRRGEEREVLASLWGITLDSGASRVPGVAPYCRVVEAELASEVLADTRDNDFLLAFTPELRALVAYAS